MYIELMFRREDGRLCHIDEAIADLLGWTAEEVIGREFEELVTGPSYAEARRVYLYGPPNSYGICHLTLDAHHKDGHTVPMHLCAACRYDDRGELVKAWGSLQHAPCQREQDELLAWWQEQADEEALAAVIHVARVYAGL